MKTLKQNHLIIFVIIFLISSIASYTIAQNNQDLKERSVPDKVYYAIEINDVVCGYSESSEMPIKQDQKDLVDQEVNIFIMLSLLGSEFNTEMNSKALVDPETGKATQIKTNIKQGATDINIELTVKENKALIKSSMSTQLKEIEIAPETVIGSDDMFTRLKKEFYSEDENGDNL